MTALYLTSMEAAAGKSALLAGLGRRLVEEGKRVGFFKPLLILPEGASAEVGDEDAEFIKQVLALEEAASSLCPAKTTLQALEADLSTLLKKIESAYAEVSPGKEVMLIEGLSGFIPESKQVLASLRIMELIDAKVVILARYRGRVAGDQIVAAARMVPKRLLGVVINAVPQHQVESVKGSLVPYLEEKGIKVLAVIPEERALFAISVADLSQHLRGQITNCPERSAELVENVMIGAMCVDPAPLYFGLKPNKAVVTRGDRPDIQLAALETSTKCLVLTNNIRPTPSILHRAEDRGVPMIVVEQDTLATVAAIEELLGKTRFSQEGKLERLGEILEQNFDFHTLYQGLAAQ